MSLKSIGIAVALLVVSGCAYIEGAQQNVTINSNPQGAIVRIDDRSFSTPATIPLLKGGNDYYFTVEKQGYKPIAGKVDRNFRVWYAIDGTITMEALPVPPASAVQPVPGAMAPSYMQIAPAPQPLLQPLPGAPVMTQPVPVPEGMPPVPVLR